MIPEVLLPGVQTCIKCLESYQVYMAKKANVSFLLIAPGKRTKNKSLLIKQFSCIARKFWGL